MVSSRLLSKIKSIKTLNCSFDYQKKEFDLKVNTDSRSFQAGETFVALMGDNFDAFNYIEGVLNQDAKVVIVNYTEDRAKFFTILSLYYPKIIFITVTDTLLFIQELARLHMESWKKADPNRIVIVLLDLTAKRHIKKSSISF